MSGIPINLKLESVLSANPHTGIEVKCPKCGTKRMVGARCKPCEKEKNRNYRLNNPERMKFLRDRWFEKHPDYTKKWAIENKERMRELQKKWNEAHPESARIRTKKYQVKNREKHIEAVKRCYRKTSATLKGNLNYRMSSGIRFSLRKEKKGLHWESLVNYNLDQLKDHIEKQFKDGMNWALFMQGKIHIDHKIPKAAFNFEKPSDIDFKKCWALNNLQPLWAFDNLSKHDNLERPFQPSLCISI